MTQLIADFKVILSFLRGQGATWQQAFQAVADLASLAAGQLTAPPSTMTPHTADTLEKYLNDVVHQHEAGKLEAHTFDWSKLFQYLPILIQLLGSLTPHAGRGQGQGGGQGGQGGGQGGGGHGGQGGQGGGGRGGQGGGQGGGGQGGTKHFGGVVKSVTGSSVTISQQDHTLTIPAGVPVTVNGQTGALSALTPGMQIQITEDASGTVTKVEARG